VWEIENADHIFFYCVLAKFMHDGCFVPDKKYSTISLSFAAADGLEPSFSGLRAAALQEVLWLPVLHQRKL
jgi:hypothetical protein